MGWVSLAAATFVSHMQACDDSLFAQIPNLCMFLEMAFRLVLPTQMNLVPGFAGEL